jgi:hypothetical protein
MIKRVYKEKAFSLSLNENEVLWNRAKGVKFWRKELWIKNKINLNCSSTEIIFKTGVHFNATIRNHIYATYNATCVDDSMEGDVFIEATS